MPATAAPTAPRFSPRTIQAVALIGVASSSFPITVLSAALPDIARDLGTTNSTITWVIAAPLLAFAVFTPMAGKLGDLHGHRRMYLVGFSLASILSVGTAFAPNVGALIAMRVLAQSASASTGPSALAIMMSVFPEEKRTSVAGTWSAVLAASPAVGVVLGGPLIDLTSWRILFLLQGAGSAVAVLFAFRVLPSTERRSGISFDLKGGLVLAASIGAILISINRAAVLGWANPMLLAVIILGVLGLPLFIWIERRTEHPLVATSVLRERNVALPLLSQIFINGPYMAGLVITSLMLGTVFEFDTTRISLLILPRPIAFAAGAWLAGRAVVRFGGRPVVVLGTTMIAVALALIGRGALDHSVWLVLIGAGLAGTGSGIARPPIIAALTSAVGEQDMGVGTGMLNMTGQIGAAAGISILSGLISNDSNADRFFVILTIAALIAVFGVLTAGLIAYPKKLDPEPPTPLPASPYSVSINPQRLHPAGTALRHHDPPPDLGAKDQ